MAGSRQAPDRSRQKARTYNAIVDAAAAELRAGRQPSVADAAAVAGVHRATAYRYFPTLDALLTDAALSVGAPDPASVVAGVSPDDPLALMDAGVRAVAEFSFREEAVFRSIVRLTIDRWFEAQGDPDQADRGPIRQTRRFGIIDAALAPLAEALPDAALHRLRMALALVFGAEAVVVTRDVCGLEPDEATEVMAWAATTLIRGALTDHDDP